ncbi:MAG: SIR2 family NAD-dependent protein deacylase [Bradymonadaceae bacterium]
MNLHAIRKASRFLLDHPRVLVCVGSGLSAESGVPTFRGPDGMFNDPRIARYTHVETFDLEPEDVLAWYQDRRNQLKEIEPNPGHHALIRLARTGDYTIATQNVDNLVETAGRAAGFEPPIHHLHGSLNQIRCHDCGHVFNDFVIDVDLSTCPRCERCGGRLRPGVVWFGEALPEEAFASAMEVARNADVCLLLGTSGMVYPAASLPETARRFGATIIEINTAMTGLSDICDVIVRGKTGEALPVLAEVVAE